MKQSAKQLNAKHNVKEKGNATEKKEIKPHEKGMVVLDFLPKAQTNECAEIESRLEKFQWLGGDTPSREDADKFVAFGKSFPDVDEYPRCFAWYILVSRFSEAVRSTWAESKEAKKKVIEAPEPK